MRTLREGKCGYRRKIVRENWDKRENRGLQTMNAKGAGNLRDPEDRIINQFCSQERKEKMVDKKVADSVPASDLRHYPIQTKTRLDRRARKLSLS